MKVLHFEGLHRDMATGEIEDEISKANVVEVPDVKVEGDYVTFKIGSAGFSPFALVWQEKIPTPPTVDPGPGGNPAEPADPDDTGVSGLLNTKDHIQYLFGYPDGTFGPGRSMTRAEAAQMFYNLLLDQNVETTASFTDVPETAWYAKAVNTLASLGILNGVGNGKYEPDRPITRAEFTTIAMKFTEGDVSGENIFSDVSENAWYYGAVVASIQYGWIEGYGDCTFRPQNKITRAEVTAIVNKMLGRQADEDFVDDHSDDLNSFSDVTPNHWAYYHIAEATNEHSYNKWTDGESWTQMKSK